MKQIVVVKKSCETCQLVVPVLERLNEETDLNIYSQDDPRFPSGLPVTDDCALAYSWRMKIETVPTLISFDEGGNETGRISGWDRSAWESVSGLEFDLGLPDFRPGCKPEYLPVVITAVEAALQDEFCMHGLLATTYFSGPLVIVNGPISRAIGMNSRGNALGQGNRANATIGRALQLVIRNVGGGKPGGVDRSVFGNPGKYTYCFAEDETGSCWESLAVERGFSEDASTVTLFAADGLQGIVDQKSREPESLCRTLAAGLRVIGHPKMVLAADAILVVSPEHERVFRLASWSKQQVKDRIMELLTLPGSELVAGAGGIAEGLPESLANKELPKFRKGGFNIVRAGGSAGMFSAIIAGWAASGTTGSMPVTREIK